MIACRTKMLVLRAVANIAGGVVGSGGGRVDGDACGCSITGDHSK